MTTSSGELSPSEFVLAPESYVRAALPNTRLAIRMLVPPFSALGVGRLRVLRLREIAEGTEMLCGYERYERRA